MEFIVNNWLYIVFAGVMIYMMTKGGGCCGGHSHSNHGDEKHGHDGSQNQNNELETVKDPICGMNVNPDTAIKQIINDKTYYFCSESCRKEFLSKQRTI